MTTAREAAEQCFVWIDTTIPMDDRVKAVEQLIQSTINAAVDKALAEKSWQEFTKTKVAEERERCLKLVGQFVIGEGLRRMMVEAIRSGT